MNLKQLIITESKQYTLYRSKERSDAHGEVFTPSELVIEMLEQLPDETWQEGKTFLDQTCGNGQFLAAVAIVKRELGHKHPLASIYGVDLLEDNVAETKARLLAICGDTKQNRTILSKQILCRNGLEYDYSFGTSAFESMFSYEV